MALHSQARLRTLRASGQNDEAVILSTQVGYLTDPMQCQVWRAPTGTTFSRCVALSTAVNCAIRLATPSASHVIQYKQGAARSYAEPSMANVTTNTLVDSNCMTCGVRGLSPLRRDALATHTDQRRALRI